MSETRTYKLSEVNRADVPFKGSATLVYRGGDGELMVDVTPYEERRIDPQSLGTQK